MNVDGYILITDEKGFREMDTRQCCHCGNHWIVVKGSGRIRGFCNLCNRVTCGSVKCMEHLAFEKRLDMVESGRLPLRAL